MEDERQGINIDPNGINKGSSESTCSKSSNNNHNNNNNNNNNITNNNNVTINGKEQDRFLPIANVGRIMKKVIPDNGKISKDAKETVQECVSEFISFITGEASDKCQREKRKTINGDDIIWAITTLGFEEYVAPLKIYLNKYRDLEGEKLNLPKQQQQQHRTGSDHHHHQKQNNSYNSNVYSSASSNLLPQPSFVSTDHQNFPFQFHQNSIQPQISPHDQIDSVGHW